jgi:adenylate cyclase
LLYSFEDFAFDTDRRELRRGALPVAVEPQVFDLLEFLIGNRHRVVSKDDLLATVWCGRIVSDSTLFSRINAARRAIGDTGEEQRLIRTITGKGVRFVGIVREQRAMPEALVPAAAPRLSLVVLPFANLSSDPDLEYIADGITDDLTTDLSRMSGSFVIARNTAFTYKGRSTDVKQLGRELCVRYVLEGSVRRTNDRVRVNVQLTDTESGAHLWADRLDIDPAGVAEAQNEIVGRLARALNFKLVEAAGRRIKQEKAFDSDAQDLLIYGWSIFLRANSAAVLEEARRMFERALEIDPASVAAKIALGSTLSSNVASYWSTSVQQDTADAEKVLIDAVRQDPNNPQARAALGLVRRLQNRLEESRIEMETAVALAPNFASAYWGLGITLILLGRPCAAICEGKKALRLSRSGAAVPIAHTALSQAHLLLSRLEPAIEHARKACVANPRLYFTHLLLAAALGLKGELEAATAALAEAIGVRPEFNSLARLRAYMTWGSPKYWALRERTINLGLRRAGMPDS